MNVGQAHKHVATRDQLIGWKVTGEVVEQSMDIVMRRIEGHNESPTPAATIIRRAQPLGQAGIVVRKSEMGDSLQELQRVR